MTVVPISEDAARQSFADWVGQCAATAYARLHPNDPSRFARTVYDPDLVPPAAAAWDGRLLLSTDIIATLHGLHGHPGRERSQREWAEAALAIRTLSHEMSHMRGTTAEADDAGAAFTRSRGLRNLEEGTTELQARVTQQAFTQLYAQATRLPRETVAELLDADNLTTYRQETSAVRAYLINANVPSVHAALDRVDAAASHRKAEVLATLSLENSPATSWLPEPTRSEVVTEAAGLVEAGFDTAGEPRADAAGSAAAAAVADLTTFRAGDSETQTRLNTRWADAYADLADALEGAADLLERGQTGLQASQLVGRARVACGTELAEAARLQVGRDLRLVGHDRKLQSGFRAHAYSETVKAGERWAAYQSASPTDRTNALPDVQLANQNRATFVSQEDTANEHLAGIELFRASASRYHTQATDYAASLATSGVSCLAGRSRVPGPDALRAEAEQLRGTAQAHRDAGRHAIHGRPAPVELGETAMEVREREQRTGRLTFTAVQPLTNSTLTAPTKPPRRVDRPVPAIGNGSGNRQVSSGPLRD